jgi:hypothetical protein
MTPEHSGSGDPIMRHEQSAEPWHSAGDPELIAAVEAHVTDHFGAPDTVWHQVVSPYVHVDVHVVAPTDERPVYTLVTSGMSERPMVADGEELYAELTLLLPPSWPHPDNPESRSPEAYWPYQLLQDLAELPHEYGTTLWMGHTVPNGDPPQPYAPDTELCGALLAPPLIAPEGFSTLTVGEREIQFLGVMALHADEMQLKLDKGLDRLVDLLAAADVTELLEPDRPSVVPPRRRRLFRR